MGERWRVERVFSGHVEWLIALGLLLFVEHSVWWSPVVVAASDVAELITMRT